MLEVSLLSPPCFWHNTITTDRNARGFAPEPSVFCQAAATVPRQRPGDPVDLPPLRREGEPGGDGPPAGHGGRRRGEEGRPGELVS